MNLIRANEIVQSKVKQGDIKPISNLYEGKHGSFYAPEEGYIFIMKDNRLFSLISYNHLQDANFLYYVCGQ